MKTLFLGILKQKKRSVVDNKQQRLERKRLSPKKFQYIQLTAAISRSSISSTLFLS